MATIAPFVRHMIVCDDVVPSPHNPRDLDVRGLLSFVRSNPPGSFPVTVPQVCVYLELSGGRGTGEVQIVTRHADTDEPAFRSAAQEITFPPDPLRIVPVVFRIRQCVFRRGGLYWVEFRYAGRPLVERSVVVE